MLINAGLFHVVDIIGIHLTEHIHRHPLFQSLWIKRPDVYDVFGHLGTVAQIAICQLRSDPSRWVLMANTHLYFHPAAEYVRLLQMFVILEELQRLREGIRRNQGYAGALSTGTVPLQVTCCLMGDLNSTTETPTIEFIMRYVSELLLFGIIVCRGFVDRHHPVWESLNAYSWRSERTNDNPADHSTYKKLAVSSEVANIDLSDCIPLRLQHALHQSADEHHHSDDYLHDNATSLFSAAGFPEFTNYTKDFVDTLDYIFVERSHFDVVSKNVLPSLASMKEEASAMPTDHLPSDHFPLVVNLRLK